MTPGDGSVGFRLMRLMFPESTACFHVSGEQRYLVFSCHIMRQLTCSGNVWFPGVCADEWFRGSVAHILVLQPVGGWRFVRVSSRVLLQCGLAAAILIKIKWLWICKLSHLLIVAANPSKIKPKFWEKLILRREWRLPVTLMSEGQRFCGCFRPCQYLPSVLEQDIDPPCRSRDLWPVCWKQKQRWITMSQIPNEIIWNIFTEAAKTTYNNLLSLF